MLRTLCTHPNVGAVLLLVSLGCESLPTPGALREAIAASGRPVQTLVIQERGGTRSTVAARPQAWVDAAREARASRARADVTSTS
jgi:altronate dehydratase large subunit